MFPVIDIENTLNGIQTKTEDEQSQLGRVVAFDFEKKEFKTIDGKLIEAETIEAIKQWVILLLNTEKGKFKVYSSDFGIELDKYRGTKGIPFSLVKNELMRQIEEQIVKHPLIKGVEDFEATKYAEKLELSFTILLKDDVSVSIEAVI